MGQKHFCSESGDGNVGFLEDGGALEEGRLKRHCDPYSGCLVRISCGNPSGSPTLIAKPFGLVVTRQGIDNRLQSSFHREVKLMKGKTDAVVGNPILREIVCPDLLATIAGSNHAFAFRADGGL